MLPVSEPLIKQRWIIHPVHLGLRDETEELADPSTRDRESAREWGRAGFL